MAKADIAQTMTKLLGLLTPLEPEERQRVISATLTLLGDSAETARGASPLTSGGPTASQWQRAGVWMKQNGLTPDMLDQVFHVDGDHVEVLASAVPGRTAKERTLNIYLLAGAARLLATGDAGFDDKYARELCTNLGSYDSTNHSKYLKDRGNNLAGSASTGWKLTGPGLKQAAGLIKQMAPAAE
jgi:hypothetical protein